MRETFGIDSRRRNLLRCLLPGHRKQFVDLHRSRASLHPDCIEFAPCECRSRQRDRHFRCGDRGAVVLVGALKPRRDVHRVAHHGIVEPPPRADVADQCFAGIEPHTMCHFVAPESGGALIEFVKTRTATQRSPRRIACMVAIVGRRTEHRHNRVADIFIDIAALAFDDVGHGRKILVHEPHQFRRCHFFRDRRKTGQVRKKHGDVACFAAQFRQFVGRQHLIDHLRRQIKREALAQQSFALVGNDEAVCDNRSHCSQAGKKRLA